MSDTTTDNALFTIILCEFNTRSSSWWTNDKTATEDTKLEFLKIVDLLHRFISQTTHLKPQSSSSIGLILTDQPSLIFHSGDHLSIRSNCHHQITYWKLNLNIKYPPSYERLVWDYNKANFQGIKKSIESVNWKLMFSNKSVHKQVSIFNENQWIYSQTLLQINFQHLMIGTSHRWMILLKVKLRILTGKKTH